MSFDTKDNVPESSRVGNCACLIYFSHPLFIHLKAVLYCFLCFRHLLLCMFIYQLIEFFSLSNNCTANSQPVSQLQKKKYQDVWLIYNLQHEKKKQSPKVCRYKQQQISVQQRQILSSVGKTPGTESLNSLPKGKGEYERKGGQS